MNWIPLAEAIFSDRHGRWQSRMAHYFGVTSRSVRGWIKKGECPQYIYEALVEMERARK